MSLHWPWVHFIVSVSRKTPRRSYLETPLLFLWPQTPTTTTNDDGTAHQPRRVLPNDLTTICSVFIALSSLSVVAGFIDFCRSIHKFRDSDKSGSDKELIRRRGCLVTDSATGHQCLGME